MSKDRSEGVLFAFRSHIPEPVMLPPLYLRGLDPPRCTRLKASRSPGPAWHE
jgi:hypothetical protein